MMVLDTNHSIRANPTSNCTSYGMHAQMRAVDAFAEIYLSVIRPGIAPLQVSETCRVANKSSRVQF